MCTHTQVFCNHSPDLNTAFLLKCVTAWSQHGPAHYQAQGGSAVAITVAKAGQLRRSPRSRALSLRAALQMGAAIKKKGGKKGQKYPESWVYNWLRLSAFFMCARSSVKNSTSHCIAQWNLIPQPPHTLNSPLLLCPPISPLLTTWQHFALDCHPGLYQNDLILISGTCKGGTIFWGNYHLIMMQPWCWVKLWVLEAERGRVNLSDADWVTGQVSKRNRMSHC